MLIVHLDRKPWPTNFSVEGYFQRVRAAIEVTSHRVISKQLPYHSRGLLKRLVNTYFAARNQGDVTHVTGDVHYAAILCRRQSTILTVLDCDALNRLSGIRRTVLRLFWYSLPLRSVSAVTVISEATKHELLKHVSFPEERIRVIPVSVSPGFTAKAKDFDSDKPRILQVGTKPNKNVPRLIEALTGIRCRLVIVGPIGDELVSLLQQRNIEFENLQRLSDQEMVSQYQQADIISFVSTYEGFGMPIVEAQCVDRAVVTSNCSSMPEVAGEGACLVDPFDVQSIRAGFQRVIGDTAYRESLIVAGRENRKRFDNQVITNQYLDLYRQVLGQRS